MSDASTPGPTPTGYQRSAGGGFMWLPPSAEHLSRLLPQYEVEFLLGRGGMGAVYKGRQKSLNRLVAIKILPPQMEGEDASYLERFKNEAQVMAKFIHPGIVAIHDFGETAEGQLYIVMEYVDGSDVSRMIATQGRLPPEHALAIAAHVCDALGYAHSHGVIHRDIKPANILINREGAVKVADFGLAKIDEPGASGLTKTGMAMGTPDYIAPEALVFGSQVDARADLYAVGVMLYHMLTGEVPRGAFDLPSHRVGIDPRFDAIILKAMKMDREERYQSSGAIRHDLDAILTLPLVRSADAPVRQQQSSPQGTETQTADEGIRAPLDPSSTRPRNSKSKATMIALASTAAVLATGAFMVLKPSSAPSRATAAGATAVGRADESGVTATAPQDAAAPKWSAPAKPRRESSVRSDEPSNTTAQGTVRTTIQAAPPAKPILVAQTNTKPKLAPDTQLGQSAPAAPSPARKPDPTKWVKLDPKVDFWSNKGVAQKGDAWVIGGSRLRSKRTASDCAIRARLEGPDGLAQGVALRISDAGFYQLEIKGKDVLLLRVNTTTAPFKYDHLKRFEGAVANIPAEGVVLGFSAIGDELKAWLGEKELGSFIDSTYKDGNFGCVAAEAVTFRDIEYQILDDTTSPAAVVAQASAAPAPPAAPPAVTLPPELTTLQQQYDKLLLERVTGIYDADVAKLNAGYLAGLDRAAAAAQSAGQLDTVLALTAEKKLLEAKQPVPATDDAKTPEALKNLRTIYRTSLAKLDEQRTANHTALLTPYTTRLKQVEADLTKAGRIPDAVAVKTYRESLGTIPVPSAPAAAAATAPAAAVPMKETPAPTASKTNEPPKNIKGDDRKAAEWVLSNWSKSSLWVDEKHISKLEELPKGKISVNHISIDARFCKNGTPAAADFQVLAGLSKLRYLQLSGFDLKDDDLAFIRTLPGLTELLLYRLNLSDAFIPHLTGLRGLSRLDINECPSFTGSTLDQLAALPQLSSIRTWKCPVTDAAVPGIAKLSKIEALNLEATRITDACLPAIHGMKQIRRLSINSTKITPAGLAATPMPHIEFLGVNKLSGRPLREIAPVIAPAFPNVFVVQISYEVEAAEDIAALAHFKKLKGLDVYGSVANAAWAGLAELRDLAGMTYDWASPLPDEALPVLAGLKKLKRLTLRGGIPSDAALAAFKKQRPDVKVEQ
ncbi:MAG: protein kinase [Verrucomicrobiaceae bacterium]|nr:protein kinase [Verrucomicrobiaceae bacterium]